MKNIDILKGKAKMAVTIPALTFALLLATSCDKEVLELTPVDRITELAAFENAARVELAVAGVYDAAQSGFYLGSFVNNRGYPFGAASVEQGDVRGEDMFNHEAFFALTYESQYSPATANNQHMWENLYALINRANVVLEALPAAGTSKIITDVQLKVYQSELLFLRALAHHELLIHFARPYDHTADASHPGVPYRTTSINTGARVDEAKAQGRNTVKECYDKILEDLNTAETSLPATRANASLKLTRATKGAVVALKTRVLLHKKDYQGVITEGNKLVPAAAPFVSPIGGYTLTASPDGPFTTAGNKGNTESVFSIDNATGDTPGVNGALPSMYAPNGRFLVAISPIIYNATFWPATDKRRTLLTALGSGTGFYYTTKYKDVATLTDNTPIIRYAEVLLNMSEALARTSPLNLRALDLLNAVRSRSTDAYSIASMVSNDAFIQAIVNERRIEFLAEGRRWADIHRLAVEGKFSYKGIPQKVGPKTAVTTADYNAASGIVRPAILGVAAIPYDNFKFVWPFPSTEVSSNPILAEQQNPGWK
ncbi:MAG: hypothetical protein JWQ14_1834 [Adhaeribacter sp.]|nr:hypothetical protein [Adhaeribacter sp.]